MRETLPLITGIRRGKWRCRDWQAYSVYVGARVVRNPDWPEAWGEDETHPPAHYHHRHRLLQLLGVLRVLRLQLLGFLLRRFFLS